MAVTVSSSVGRGIFYVAIAAVAWGTGGAAAAILYDISGLGPIAVSFWRFAGGVALLAGAHVWLSRRSVQRRSVQRQPMSTTAVTNNGRWHRIVTTGIGLAVYQTAYFAAVGYAGLAVATVVTLGAGPILIAIGARVTMSERLGRAEVTTVALALTGLVLLVGGGSATTARAPWLGLACAILSAAGYAGVTLLNRHIGQAGGSIEPHARALGGFAVGMVVLLPLALLEGILPTSGDLRQVAGLLLYLGAAPTALAYSLFFSGLATVRATTASVIALIEPVTAAVIALALLGERLSATATVGAVTLLGAVAALTMAERRAGPCRSREPTP